MPWPTRGGSTGCRNGTPAGCWGSGAGASATPRPSGVTRTCQPRRPEQNGKVERSHRIDAEEFWGRHAFELFEAAAAALGQWERVYNELRFSMALNGRTPAEKLAAVLAAA